MTIFEENILKGTGSMWESLLYFHVNNFFDNTLLPFLLLILSIVTIPNNQTTIDAHRGGGRVGRGGTSCTPYKDL
jgi:hypothetical protein